MVSMGKTSNVSAQGIKRRAVGLFIHFSIFAVLNSVEAAMVCITAFHQHIMMAKGR